jgi:hypothetical protein
MFEEIFERLRAVLKKYRMPQEWCYLAISWNSNAVKINYDNTLS